MLHLLATLGCFAGECGGVLFGMYVCSWGKSSNRWVGIYGIAYCKQQK